MRSHTLVLTPLIGLCLLEAQIVNPFEAVPESPQSPPPKVSGPAIQAIEFQAIDFWGAKRVPPFALRLLAATRVGGAYDEKSLQRDAEAVYNTGRFSYIGWKAEPGPAGAIVRFVVVERPLIRSIEYQGDDTVTIGEILERFEQRKVKLRPETLFNEDDLPRAAATVQELIAERGRQNIKVTPSIEPISPPSSVRITFRIEEKQ